VKRERAAAWQPERCAASCPRGSAGTAAGGGPGTRPACVELRMPRAAQAEYEATGSQRIMFRRGIAELQHLVSGALADGPAGAGGGADEADDEVGPGPRVQRVD
jgi:hypothetical protein